MMKTFTTLLIVILLISSPSLYAQPSVTPAATHEWVKTGSATYNSGEVSTSPNITSGNTSYDINPGENSSPYIQAQVFGNYGNNNGSGAFRLNENNDAPGAGYLGTPLHSNFLSSASQTRTLTLSDWNNTNPESAISPGATSGTVHIQTGATLNIVQSPSPGAEGTGAGGDENYLEFIGGVSGDQSRFDVWVDYSMSWSLSALGGGSGSSGSQNYTITDIVHNDAGPSGHYFTANWASAFGQSFSDALSVTSVEDGASFDVSFTGTASIGISRDWGNADARATHGPGMEGRASLSVSYDIWELQPIAAPVDLLYLRAESQGDNILLDWATATEENSSHFEIQRSTDGREFEVIAEVNSNQNSAVTQTYEYLDEGLSPNKYYYRLRMVDLDDTYEYSAVQSAEITSTENRPVIAPNPNNGTFNITGISQFNHLLVYNKLGQVVYENNNIDNTEIKLPNPSPGVYFIMIETAEGIYHSNMMITKY